MSISGIGTSSYNYATALSQNSTTGMASSSYATIPKLDETASPSATGTSPETQFLDYMKKSPGQRMIDKWLAAHHLTEKDLESMSPEKQKAIKDQMAKEIKDETERKATQNPKTATNILV